MPSGMAKKNDKTPYSFLRHLETRDRDLKSRVRRVLRRIPDRPTIFSTALSPVSLAIEVCHLKKNFEGGVFVAEQAIDNNPDDPQVWVGLAKALAALNMVPPARKALARARRLGADNAEADYLRACFSRDDQAALEYVLSACEKDAAYAEALFLCSRLALKVGWHTEGLRMLESIQPLMENSVQRPMYEKFLAEAQGRPAPTNAN